jgi:hypothetical protein
VDPGQIFQAEFVRAVGAVPQTRLFHKRPPPSRLFVSPYFHRGVG